jgi:hypothetical protein
MKARITLSALSGIAIVIFALLSSPVDRAQLLLHADRSNSANLKPQETGGTLEMVPAEAPPRQ